MFNALRSDELLVGIGRVLRLVAAAPGELQEYERSQALSAYSVTRLLAAEEAASPQLLAWAKQATAGALAGDDREAVINAGGAVQSAADGAELGEALAGVLAALPADDTRRRAIHAMLAELVDREVAALAGAPK
jgi:hypothetical protein